MKKIYTLLISCFVGLSFSCGKSPDPRSNYDAIQKVKQNAQQESQELNNAIPK